MDRSSPSTRRTGPTPYALLWGLLILLALASRLPDLGARALHHDESLHAAFSWYLYRGRGYVHTPLMHGPFLFFANALAFLLLGDTDATARLAPALAGVLLVLAPLLGRPLLGRRRALLAGLFLLLSPSVWYYSRFLRHDVYTALGTLVLWIAWRRARRGEGPRWVLLAWYATLFLLTTKEVAYILLALFGLHALLESAAGGGRRTLTAVLAWLALGGLWALGTRRLWPSSWPPAPPWEPIVNDPTFPEYALLIGTYALELLRSPFLWGLLLWGLTGPLLAWRRGLPLATPLPGWRQVRWRLHLPLGLLYYFGLHTTFFLNPAGFLSGPFGSILYWLGQHGVQRGHQPPYYYLLLLPYEPVAVLGLLVGLAWGARWGVERIRRRRPPLGGAGKGSPPPLPEGVGDRLSLITWGWGILLALTWAGEKMPWLLVHIALPGALLAASLLPLPRREAVGAWLLGLPGLLGSGLLAAYWARHLAPFPFPFVLLPFGLAATVGLLAAHGKGASPALRALLVGWLLVPALLLQTAYGSRLAFRDGDVPWTPLIYVQTSPDLHRLVNRLYALERARGGEPGEGSLTVLFDRELSWPLEWYLRNLPGRRYEPEPTPDQALEADVLWIYLPAEGRVRSALEEAGYVRRVYPLRWWFEEDVYREPTVLWKALTGEAAPEGTGWTQVLVELGRNPRARARLLAFFLLRQPLAPVGGVDFVLYARPEIAPFLFGPEPIP